MNSLPFEEASLDSLNSSLTLNESSEIDTALLSDIDGKYRGRWRGGGVWPWRGGGGGGAPALPSLCTPEIACLAGCSCCTPCAGEMVCVHGKG